MTLHLSALEYVHGERHSIAALSGELNAELLGPDTGLSYYRSSDQEIWQLAAAAGTRTVGASAEPPDLVVYVTENDHQSSDSMTCLVRALGLPAAHYLRVSGHACGNLGPALLLAQQALASGEHRRILLLLADRVLNGDRNQTNGLSVVSDGAVACLVTDEPTDFDGARFAVHGVTAVTNLEAADPGQSGEGVLATVALSVAGITAITRQTEREVHDFDHLVLPNYRMIIQQFLCSGMGASTEQLLVGPLSEYGHCFSADVLVTLAHCASAGQIQCGDHVLVSANGPTSWTSIAVERIG